MNKCDILVLEDETLIGIDIRMTLEAAGYENVAVCSTIEGAIELIEKCEPKIGLLDINLGRGMDSLPVAELLNERGKPIIFISGYTETTVQVPSALSNAGRLAKPFQSAELISIVERALKDT